jgi:HSP20 family protein
MVHSNHKRKRNHNQDFFEEIGNAFNELLGHEIAEVFTQKRPLANIIEEAGGFKLAIALPGFSKEDLSIKLDKNKLIVSADIKSEDEPKYKLKEFAYNKFSRTFGISPKVDKSKIKASMTNGILYVNLPKRAEEKDAEAHNIEIS